MDRRPSSQGMHKNQRPQTMPEAASMVLFAASRSDFQFQRLFRPTVGMGMLLVISMNLNELRLLCRPIVPVYLKKEARMLY